jgi:diguanylate cyclase (GGDEF)-like protein
VNHESEAPDRGSKEIAKLTILGAAACLVVSLGFNYLLELATPLTAFGRYLASAVGLPLLIGGPLFFFLGRKIREAKRYRRELNRAATYDQLTASLNGPVFSSVIDRRAQSKAKAGSRHGAFLLIDAEHIRSINLQHGFDWGNEAVRLVAATIRSSVRSGDIIGRLGPSEFGVFLPGATEENARDIGERIRAEVAKVYFAPDGQQDTLSVSVGGIIYENEPRFDDLFRAAGQRLSNVEGTGKMELAHLAARTSDTQPSRPSH